MSPARDRSRRLSYIAVSIMRRFSGCSLQEWRDEAVKMLAKIQEGALKEAGYSARCNEEMMYGATL
jgi:hypothetical protein